VCYTAAGIASSGGRSVVNIGGLTFFLRLPAPTENFSLVSVIVICFVYVFFDLRQFFLLLRFTLLVSFISFPFKVFLVNVVDQIDCLSVCFWVKIFIAPYHNVASVS